MRRWVFSVVVACVLAALASAPAVADDEARARASCTRSSAAELRVRSDGRRLRVELELRNRGPATRWQVVVVHERRMAWRGSVRTPARGSARVRRELAATRPAYGGTLRSPLVVLRPDALDISTDDGA